ncbi:hypothetical protein C8R44DRAFT_744968 [Mycena epipterygia]|nr:hypothetical protein C8R44DRAFT_744968 [Mycena epipterygia]
MIAPNKIQPCVRLVPYGKTEYMSVILLPAPKVAEIAGLADTPTYQMMENGRGQISVGTHLYCEGALHGIITATQVLQSSRRENWAFLACIINSVKTQIILHIAYRALRWEVPALRIKDPDHSGQSFPPPASVGGPFYIPQPRQRSAKRDEVIKRITGQVPRIVGW